MGGRKNQWLLQQVSWITGDGRMEQDGGNWFAKEKKKKDQKGRTDRIGFGDWPDWGKRWEGEVKHYSQISEPGTERMMVPTYYFPSGNIDKILKILLFSVMYTDINRAKNISDLILANMIFIF